MLPLLLHTDASFAGQGLVAEMFQLSKLAPFDLGGTIHIVIDNQVGFTTEPEDARSAHLSTDIARLVEAPVIHVNGDDVEAVYRAGLVAANWRATFGSDIVVRLVCYRRPGHNEIDEPRFTQPMMCRAIESMTPVHELYAARVAGGAAIAAAAAAGMDADLKAAFDGSKSYAVNSADWFGGAWSGLTRGTVEEMLAPVATGVPLAELRRLGRLHHAGACTASHAIPRSRSSLPSAARASRTGATSPGRRRRPWPWLRWPAKAYRYASAVRTACAARSPSGTGNCMMPRPGRGTWCCCRRPRTPARSRCTTRR